MKSSLRSPDRSGIKSAIATAVAQLIVLKKQAAKIYQKMANHCANPALKKCLSPAETQIQSHLDRMKLIAKFLEIKVPAAAASTSTTTKYGKASSEQDLELILQSLQLQHEMMAICQWLQTVTKANDWDIPASLLEQTLEDDRNTNVWLNRIISSVIVPDLNAGEASPDLLDQTA